MSLDQWSEYWRVGRTGFHRPEVHEALIKHGDWLLNGGPRVCVPLCGKSVDLVWLAARTTGVLGVEMVEQAIREFLFEQDLPVTQTASSPFRRWHTAGPTILQGDLFDLTQEEVGPIQAIWDRAAMVAIHPQRRRDYVRKLVELLDPGSRILLIGWDASRAADVGPPYCLRTEEVRTLYSSIGEVESVGSTLLTPDTDARVAEKGLDWMRLDTYRITLR